MARFVAFGVGTGIVSFALILRCSRAANTTQMMPNPSRSTPQRDHWLNGSCRMNQAAMAVTPGTMERLIVVMAGPRLVTAWEYNVRANTTTIMP